MVKIRSVKINEKALNEMANLKSSTTGIPNVAIYVSPMQHSAGPRVKVGRKPTDYRFVLSISDDPQIMEGQNDILTSNEFWLVRLWIIQNKDALLQFWNREILYEKTLLKRLNKVTPGKEGYGQNELEAPHYDELLLSPDETGIPDISVYVSSSNGSLEPRVLVGKNPMKFSFSVLISSSPVVLGGDVDISAEKLNLIFKWVLLNKNLLLDYWNGSVMYVEDFFDLLKTL